jgi:hypothetical protein
MSLADDIEYDADYFDEPRCKRCGCTDVWWNDTAKGWLLMEGAKAHSCPVDLDDFPST